MYRGQLYPIKLSDKVEGLLNSAQQLKLNRDYKNSFAELEKITSMTGIKYEEKLIGRIEIAKLKIDWAKNIDFSDMVLGNEPDIPEGVIKACSIGQDFDFLRSTITECGRVVKGMIRQKKFQSYHDWFLMLLALYNGFADLRIKRFQVLCDDKTNCSYWSENELDNYSCTVEDSLLYLATSVASLKFEHSNMLDECIKRDFLLKYNEEFDEELMLPREEVSSLQMNYMVFLDDIKSHVDQLSEGVLKFPNAEVALTVSQRVEKMNSIIEAMRQKLMNHGET